MKKPISRGAVAVCSILVVLLVSAGVMLGLLLTDDNAGKYSAEPSTELLGQVAASALTGKEQTISVEQFNGFAAYQLAAYRERHPDGNAVLEQAVFAVNSDNTVAAYTPVTVNGVRLGVTSVSEVTFDREKKQLAIDVQRVKIGRVGVPVKSFLKNALSGRLPDGATLSGSRLLIDASLLSVQAEELDTKLEIADLRVENGGVTVLATGLLDKVKDELERRFGDLGSVLGQYADDLISYFQNQNGS